MAIDCPCDNNCGSLTGFAIVDKTAKALKGKLVKLTTKKRWLGLAYQVRLAELELVDLRRGQDTAQYPYDQRFANTYPSIHRQ